MLFKFTSLIILFIISFKGYSQLAEKIDIDYEMSSPYDQIALRTLVAGVTSGHKNFSKNGEVLQIKWLADRIFLQKFSGSKLDESKRSEASIEGALNVKFIEHKSKFNCFVVNFDRRANKTTIVKKEIDFDNCLLLENEEVIAEIDGKIRDYEIYIDKSKGSANNFLVSYAKYPTEKKDALSKKIIGFVVFDENCKVTRTAEITLPFVESRMRVLKTTVDNNGNIQMLMTVAEEGGNIWRNEGTHAEHYTYSEGGDQISRIINSGEHHLTPSDYLINNKGELFILGSFGVLSSKDSKFYAKGLYMMQVLDGQETDISLYPIPNELMKQYMDAKELEQFPGNTEVILGGMDLDDYIIQDDALIMICEQFLRRSTSDSEIYFHKDIYVMKVTWNGKMLWVNKIPKRQKSTASAKASGFYTHSTDNGIYVFFADAEKNSSVGPDSSPIEFNANNPEGVLAAVKIHNETGKFVKKSVLDLKNTKGKVLEKMMFRNFIWISPNQFCFEFEAGKGSDAIIKFTIN